MLLNGKNVRLQKGDKILIKKKEEGSVLVSVVSKDGETKTWKDVGGLDDKMYINMGWNQILVLVRIMISSAGLKKADIIKREEKIFIFEIKA